MPKLPCAQCGAVTYHKPSRIKKQKNCFCSRRCLAAFQCVAFYKPRVTITCEFCKVECEKQKRFVNGSKGRFCSLDCYCKSHHSITKAAKRFWKYVNKTERCWLWTGGKYCSGYGNFKSHQCKTGAHRFSWELHNGPIPKGKHILHKCDVPACVNPSHLFLGNRKDNSRDMALKNRGANSKWSIEEIQEMRALDKRGWSRKQIKNHFGISLPHLCSVLKGIRRAHV